MCYQITVYLFIPWNTLASKEWHLSSVLIEWLMNKLCSGFVSIKINYLSALHLYFLLRSLRSQESTLGCLLGFGQGWRGRKEAGWWQDGGLGHRQLQAWNQSQFCSLKELSLWCAVPLVWKQRLMISLTSQGVSLKKPMECLAHTDPLSSAESSSTVTILALCVLVALWRHGHLIWVRGSSSLPTTGSQRFHVPLAVWRLQEGKGLQGDLEIQNLGSGT